MSHSFSISSMIILSSNHVYIILYLPIFMDTLIHIHVLRYHLILSYNSHKGLPSFIYSNTCLFTVPMSLYATVFTLLWRLAFFSHTKLHDFTIIKNASLLLWRQVITSLFCHDKVVCCSLLQIIIY